MLTKCVYDMKMIKVSIYHTQYKYPDRSNRLKLDSGVYRPSTPAPGPATHDRDVNKYDCN